MKCLHRLMQTIRSIQIQSKGGFMQGGEFDCNATLMNVNNDWKVGTADACNLNTYFYDDLVYRYWPGYNLYEPKDDMKKAFNIAKNLMDKKLIKCDTIKQFIDLVDIIVKEL